MFLFFSIFFSLVIISSSRTIINNSNDDVILLRISDAGDNESGNNANLTVEKVDHQSTFQVISEGFKSSIKSLYG